ncbi:hypothetical protein AB1Y20_014452 [Prymnesium parvum]|uniref:Methyltransferase FkbM domain-containing protein n=1 Tax=Prymnesium parvum TaxID=97485 RepID=A0AB34IGD3_PRYPA
MASIVPSHLSREGWRLEAPPTPHIERTARCSKERQGCLPDCVHRRPRLLANRSSVCERCECSLCFVCAYPVSLYTSPSGQAIEAITTHTQPRFTFAYSPYDDDMKRMARTLILEPTLTHAWFAATHRCCNGTDGLVVDVGGNFGWYTLYSLALGCKVVVFEPVPAYQEVMRLGLALNPGFASRATIYGNVVYNVPGVYTLRVPIPSKIRLKKLGMTGMDGAAGILKADWRARSYEHKAASVRIDDLVQQDVCMLKADVEGYEAQVLQTAANLLATRTVPAIQLELTRTPSSRNQTCATIKMLQQLDRLGYHFKQVTNREIDQDAPPVGQWESQGRTLPSFPSSHRPKRGGDASSRMHVAYRRDFTSFSTNLIGYRSGPPPKAPKWPSLDCAAEVA